jgi:hypothetical protein
MTWTVQSTLDTFGSSMTMHGSMHCFIFIIVYGTQLVLWVEGHV